METAVNTALNVIAVITIKQRLIMGRLWEGCPKIIEAANSGVPLNRHKTNHC